METFEKIKRSWWVIFPLTIFLPGVGFLYLGFKTDNKNWIIEGITYQLPFFFYLLACAVFSPGIMLLYYIWLILLAALIALVRSIMVAIRLLEVYENENRPRIAASTTNANSSSTSQTAKSTDDKSKWPACCLCIIFIFIVFAIISIL